MALISGDPNIPGVVLAEQGATPANPAAGKRKLYVGTDGLLRLLDPGGTVSPVAAGGYATVQDEGAPLAQRSALNVVGRGLVVDDAGGATRLRGLDPLTMLYEWDDFVSGPSATSATTGKLNWQGPGGALNANLQAGEAGHPGIARIASGTATSSLAWLMLSTTNGVLGTDSWDCLLVWRQTTPDATNGVRLGVAFTPNGSPPAAGAYVEKLAADASYYPVTRAASVETRGSALAAVDGAWHKARVRRISPTQVGITLDALAEVVHTANLPTVALQPFVQVFNSSTNALSRSIDVDFVDLLVTGLAR